MAQIDENGLIAAARTLCCGETCRVPEACDGSSDLNTSEARATITAYLAALPPMGDVGELVKQLSTARAVERDAAYLLTSQAARLAELERERDEAKLLALHTKNELAEVQHLLAHTREWNTEWLLKNKERVASATTHAKRLEAALRECFAVIEAFGKASDGHVSPAVWGHYDAAGALERTRAALQPPEAP